MNWRRAHGGRPGNVIRQPRGRRFGSLSSLIARPVMALVVVASLVTTGIGIGALSSALPAAAVPTNCGDTQSYDDSPSTILNGDFTTGNVTLNLQRHEEATSTLATNSNTHYPPEIAPHTQLNGRFSYCTKPGSFAGGANTTAWYTIDSGTYVVKVKSEASRFSLPGSASCEIQRNGTDTPVTDSPYMCTPYIATLNYDVRYGLLVATRFYVQEKPTQTIVGNTPLGITMQTQLLSQYCSDKNNPSCSYVVTSPPRAELGPPAQIGYAQNNCSSSPQERTFAIETTKSTEDNIGLTLTAGASFDAYIFKVSTSVSTTYSTKVSTSEKFSQTTKVVVPHGKSSVAILRVQYDHVSGDFHVATPTTNFVLKNVDWLFPNAMSTLTFNESPIPVGVCG
jgi:hypothetical protein